MSIHFNTVQATGPLAGLQRLGNLPAPGQAGASSPQPIPKDDIRLSQEARDVAATTANDSGSLSGVRLDLVNRIRAEIAEGTYETPEKFATALDKMLVGFGAR